MSATAVLLIALPFALIAMAVIAVVWVKLFSIPQLPDHRRKWSDDDDGWDDLKTRESFNDWEGGDRGG